MRKIYVSFLLSFGVFTMTKAQIIYTDISPDEVYTADQQYFLDVNNDGTDDYIIEQVDSVLLGNPLEGVQLRSIGGVNEAIYETGSITFLASKLSGSLIDVTELWTVPTPSLPGGGFIMTPGPVPAGDWADLQEHYAGLRFTVASNVYYGWVRFQMSTGGLGFTMMDYAYRTTPDQPLLAGATVDGVEENEFSAFSYLQNGTTLTIRNNENNNSSIDVFDLSGKLLMNENMKSNLQNLDLSVLENGIYIVRCTNENGTKEFKISLNK